jgi:hypothetical protein
MEIAEGTLQSASAPIPQNEVETHRYKGAIYEKGADGQWHLRQSQASAANKSLDQPIQAKIFTSEQATSYTQMGPAANQDDGGTLPGAAQPESMAYASADAPPSAILSADEAQAPFKPMETAEGTLQSASAPIPQNETGTRRYKVLTYLQGADGEWYLQQTQTTVVNMQTPNIVSMTPAPIAQDAAFFQAEFQAVSAKDDSIRAVKSTSQARAVSKKRSQAKAATLPSMMTSTKASAPRSMSSDR